MIVGLTGGIGSGKTTVAKLFEIMNCIIYNSDERAKEIYFKPQVKASVIELLGEQAYSSNNTLNKDYIAKAVFSNSELLQKLNAIIHPAVKQDFEEFVAKQNPTQIILKETALLFEADIYKQVDFSILVTAPTELRIKRVKKRNSITEDEIKNRINAQWSDEQKIPLANFVIYNNDKEALIPQVITILNSIKNSKNKKAP